MNKKIRLFLPILLLILIISYLLLRNNAPEEKTRSVFSLKPEKIDQIEIWTSEDSLLLRLIDGTWKIPVPIEWEADSTKVNRLFEDVFAAEYATTAVSSGKTALEYYELDDASALHVKATAGSKSVHILFSNLGNSWDYFRHAGDNQVYQVKNKVVQYFQPQHVYWRKPFTLQYWEEELRSIRSRHAENDFTLSRDGSQWTYTDASQSFIVPFDNFGLVKIISILQNFSTNILADGRDQQLLQAFQEPLCEVWITTTSGKTHKLSFAKLDKDRHMLMVDDDSRVLFQVSFDTVFRFMRHAEVFRREFI